MTHLSCREDLDAMLVTVEGQMNPDDHRRALEAFVHNEHFHPNMSTIWDLRKADLGELSSDNIRETVTAAIQSAEWRGTHWKTAVVVEGDLAFGLMRMSELLADGAPYQIEVFRTMEEAEVWVKEGPN